MSIADADSNELFHSLERRLEVLERTVGSESNEVGSALIQAAVDLQRSLNKLCEGRPELATFLDCYGKIGRIIELWSFADGAAVSSGSQRAFLLERREELLETAKSLENLHGLQEDEKTMDFLCLREIPALRGELVRLKQIQLNQGQEIAGIESQMVNLLDFHQRSVFRASELFLQWDQMLSEYERQALQTQSK